MFDESLLNISTYIYIYVYRVDPLRTISAGMCPGPGQEENRARGPRFSGPMDFHRFGARNPRSRFRREIVTSLCVYKQIHIYIHIIYMYILICISAICFEHVGGHGMGMFTGPG